MLSSSDMRCDIVAVLEFDFSVRSSSMTNCVDSALIVYIGDATFNIDCYFDLFRKLYEYIKGDVLTRGKGRWVVLLRNSKRMLREWDCFCGLVFGRKRSPRQKVIKNQGLGKPIRTTYKNS